MGLKIMSRRPCNRCILSGMEKLAKAKNFRVTIVPHPIETFPEGVDVYIHPPNYKPPEIRKDKEEPAEWWAAWFAKLGDKCAC